MVLRADQGKDGAAVGPRARRRAMAALSCAALVAGLAAAAPAAVAAGRRLGAATALAAVPGSQLWVSRLNGPAASTGGFARAVAVSPDGATVFVTGENSFGSGPGLRHGGLRRGHRRAAVGQPLQRARQPR